MKFTRQAISPFVLWQVIPPSIQGLVEACGRTGGDDEVPASQDGPKKHQQLDCNEGGRLETTGTVVGSDETGVAADGGGGGG